MASTEARPRSWQRLRVAGSGYSTSTALRGSCPQHPLPLAPGPRHPRSRRCQWQQCHNGNQSPTPALSRQVYINNACAGEDPRSNGALTNAAQPQNSAHLPAQNAEELPEFRAALSGACTSTRIPGYCWNKHLSANPSRLRRFKISAHV